MLTRGMKGNSSRGEDEKGEGQTEKSKKGGGDDEGKQHEENAAATVDTEHEAPPMEETPEQIQEWRSWYEHQTTMEMYINSLLTTETNNSQLWTSQKRVVPVLAKLALLKDSPVDLTAQYGVLYRWIWQFEEEMKNEGEACFVSTYKKREMEKEDAQETEENSALSAGWRWMLQLNVKDKRGKEDDWWDWVYIKQSNREGAHLGLFAGRHFPKDCIIGYYTGPIMWTCPIPGTEKPSDNYLAAQGVLEDSEYALCVKNKDCVWQLVDPKPVAKEPGSPLYLGGQYLNSACRSFAFGSPEFHSAKKDQNCLLVEDGSIKATKKIGPGTELLTGYGADEHDIEQKTKVDEEKKGSSKKRKKAAGSSN
jgi:hypothetical protein